MVEFDIASDGRFEASLQLLGIEGRLDVLEAIAAILDQDLAWDEFVAEHGWEPLILHGADTYPGAMDLFSFVLRGQAGQYYQVIATTIDQAVVICAVARRFTLAP